MEIEKRFWEKVNKTNNIEDCWEWNASSRGNGYGSIKYNKKVIDAHRLSWMLANNNFNLTNKDFICHKCDNRKCVNPNHLFLGDAQINAKDAFDKGRLNILTGGKKFIKGNIPKNKIYSDELIKEVLEYINQNPNKSIISICKIYNIKYQTIRDIRRKGIKSTYKELTK